jgi:valyl-tRNA synthetase
LAYICVFILLFRFNLFQVVAAKAAQSKDFPDGIPECGADALRFGLLAYTVQGRDVNLDIKRVVGYRQFCNKIWNAFKFTLSYMDKFVPYYSMQNHITWSVVVQPRDRWILSRLNATIVETTAALNSYLFGNATTALHSFFLYDVCDVYLELVKPVFQDRSEGNFEAVRLTQATLYVIMDYFLRLAHPFMPFVTEELWQRLPMRSCMNDSPSVMVAAYPTPVDDWENAKVEKNMQLVKDAIHGARSLRADYKIANHIKADFYFRTEAPELKEALLAQAQDFCTLARGNCFTYLDAAAEVPKGCCVKVLSDALSLVVDLTGIIDVDTEIARLTKEVERLAPLIDGYRRKVAAPGYDKVPEAVRAVNTEKLAGYETELEAVNAALATFTALK